MTSEMRKHLDNLIEGVELQAIYLPGEICPELVEAYDKACKFTYEVDEELENNA
jgi:hypothetical protein